jgi:hypothetical protein
MDIPIFQRGTRLRESLSQAVAQLGKHRTKTTPNPEILKIARGVALLILSLGLGWTGKTLTEQNVRTAILEGEWPSPAVLKTILQQGGWQIVQMSDYDAYLKLFPSSVHGQAGIWTSEDHWAVFIQKSGNESELWSRMGSRPPSKTKFKWNRLGSGYNGVNQLARIKPFVPKKAVSYIDPNEIRY